MMSPARKHKRQQTASGDASIGAGSASSEWVIAFYQSKDGTSPALQFLLSDKCPSSVRQTLLAVVVAVQQAPPPSFPPSHLWHVMRDEMKGFHEARDEYNGTYYRLFCVLDRKATEHGLDASALTLICGGMKAPRTKMDASVYNQALAYREDYLKTRRILLPPGVPASAMKQRT